MNFFTNIKQKFNSSFGKNKTKKDGSGKVKEFIAKLSKGLMLPIAILPIAGLFLGIGAAIAGQAPTSNGAQAIIGKIISTPGDVIFGSLPVLFAVAIAIAFTGDVGVPALAAIVGWLVFNGFQSALIVDHGYAGKDFLFWAFKDGTWLDLLAFEAIFGANLGIQSMNTGVFGGMVVGWFSAFLYNKFKNIQLPSLLGFFSGARFIPIITFVTAIGLGLIFAMVWPILGMGFFYIGKGLTAAPGGLNSLIFGFFNRVLVPFGLHHVFNTLMWFSNVGGTFDTSKLAYVFVDGHYYIAGTSGTTWEMILGTQGKSVVGDINIYLEMMKLVGKSTALVSIDGSPAHNAVTLTFDMIFKGTAKTSADNLITCNPGQYTTGAYVFSLFALPAAALAMIMATPKGENRKVATSIVASAGAVCFLTGITEPIEFTFLFLAPALYWGFHAVMAAIGWMLCTMLSLYAPAIGPHVGFSFSSGFLDFTIYGIIADAVGGKSNTFTPLLLSALWGVIYYFVFYFSILKWDIKTPGRGENTKLFTKKDYLEAKSGKANLAINVNTKVSSTKTADKKQFKNDKDSKMRDLSLQVIKAYGGLSNIRNVDACITKLRIEVVNPDIVDKDTLMSLGARGVLKPAPKSVYAVFGMTADRIKNEIKDIMSEK